MIKISSTIDFGGASARLQAAAVDSLPAILSLIQAASNAKAPHDRGDLIGSSDTSPDGLRGTVYYDAAYAPYQHEGMRQDGTHVIRNRPAGGESKFLENTVNDPSIQAQCWAIAQARLAASLGG